LIFFITDIVLVSRDLVGALRPVLTGTLDAASSVETPYLAFNLDDWTRPAESLGPGLDRFDPVD
jgi:hypothetical protein